MIRNPFDRVASKQNDCFSDFPFPDHVPDYPSHTHMAEYIKSYTNGLVWRSTSVLTPRWSRLKKQQRDGK